MQMVLLAVGGLCALIGLVSSIFILIDAFQKSVGKGFMVLCIPCYIIYYLSSEFEHPKKSLIVTGWIIGVVGNILVNIVTRVMMHSPGF
jgi:benzodiazapine receptor